MLPCCVRGVSAASGVKLNSVHHILLCFESVRTERSLVFLTSKTIPQEERGWMLLLLLHNRRRS